jgi:uroporphyrinogen decarboxylase
MVLMYRGKASTNSILLKHFLNIDQYETDRIYYAFYNDLSVSENHKELLRALGADIFSGGYTVTDFLTYFPVYTGPESCLNKDHLYWYSWGIDNKVVELSGYDTVIYGKNPPLAGIISRSDLIKHDFPKMEWFNFSKYYPLATGPRSNIIEFDDIYREDKEIKCTGLNNSIFTMCSYLRGMENFLNDLAFNIDLAARLIDKVGSFCLEFNRKLISKLGDRIDLYAIWDDFAMQNGMMLSPSMWRKILKPWYKGIIEEAKRHNLIIMFHCCGSYHEIVGDLIELGVDILDPIQSSAREWDLEILHKNYGNHLCFHGGIDIQFLINKGPGEIAEETRRLKRIFNNNSGIILGPSAELTPDIPIKNILAIYQDQNTF